MKTVWLLIRLRLKALLYSSFTTSSAKKKNKKPSVGVMILLGVLMLYVFVMFAFLFGSLAAIMLLSLQDAGQDLSFYFAAVAALAFLLCVFGSVFATQSELYNAKDNELLLSMPVRPSAILISRMLLLLCINLLFGAIVILPAFVIYLLLGAPTAGGVIAFLFFFTLIPVLALAVSCILGWLIALVTSRMKRKNLVSLICSLTFFVVYMYAMMSMNTIIEKIEMDMLAIVEGIGPYLTVFWWLGYAIGQGSLLYGLLFTLLFAAVTGLTMYVLSRTYIRIITTNRGGVRYVYREKKVKQSGAMGALIRKELRHFTGNTMYMMNEGLGLLVAPILGVVLLFNRETVNALLATEELAMFGGMIPALLAGAMCFLSSMVIISAPSVSLEGKNLWIAQSLPVHPKTVLLSKAYMHILVCTPFFLVTSALCAIAVSASFLDTLGLILLPFACNALCAYLGVTFNTLFPKFDWINETAAVKSGVSVMLTMFGMMIVGIGIDVGLVVLSILGIPTFVSMLLATALLAGVTWALHMYLSGAGARRFARM